MVTTNIKQNFQHELPKISMQRWEIKQHVRKKERIVYCYSGRFAMFFLHNSDQVDSHYAVDICQKNLPIDKCIFFSRFKSDVKHSGTRGIKKF